MTDEIKAPFLAPL